MTSRRERIFFAHILIELPLFIPIFREMRVQAAAVREISHRRESRRDWNFYMKNVAKRKRTREEEEMERYENEIWKWPVAVEQWKWIRMTNVKENVNGRLKKLKYSTIFWKYRHFRTKMIRGLKDFNAGGIYIYIYIELSMSCVIDKYL